MDGDDWALSNRRGERRRARWQAGRSADGHHDALLTIGVRRDAPVDAITAALRQAAVSAGLDTIESESGLALLQAWSSGRARAASCSSAASGRGVAAVAVSLCVEIKQ